MTDVDGAGIERKYIEQALGNYKNTQYYGTLYLGSEQEPHEFIFDTGSPWLWAATTDC